LPVSAIEAYYGSMTRKCFSKRQEETDIQKEYDDHANMTQKGNPTNKLPASVLLLPPH
jgi:hypothetical protein